MRRAIIIGLAATASAGDVDCSGADFLFDMEKVFDVTGSTGIYEEQLWQTMWYISIGDYPGKNEGQWTLLGHCIPGTIPEFGDGHQEQDCANAWPWEAKPYTDKGIYVWYENGKYVSQWYVEPTDIPQTVPPKDSAWIYLGPCIDGTAGEGPDTGDHTPYDCTNIDPWIGSKVYHIPFAYNVSFEGGVYNNRYHTQSNPPTEGAIENGDHPWTKIGKCIEGTEQDPPDTSLPVEIAKMLCTCCEGCATIEAGQAFCGKEFGDKCYFTDCHKFNTFDEQKCSEYKKGGFMANYQGVIAPPRTLWPRRVFAPFMDAGLSPYLKLSEIAQEIGVKHFILAFVQGASNQTITGCNPGFAGVMPISAGPTIWNQDIMGTEYLYDEINRLRELGGDVAVSFGGAMGIELADLPACQEEGDPVENLVKAYGSVIEFLKLQQIDFDVEGGAISTINMETGWTYRFDAVKKLIEKYKGLKVAWTLPVLPTGLTNDGRSFLELLVHKGVPIHRLNVMTMDYGEDSVCPGNEMARCERDAISHLAEQVYEILNQAGAVQQYGIKRLHDVYALLGSTPMLGMNDVTTETYTVADAKENIQEWNTNQPIGFLSMWSMHRDNPCDLTYVDTTCSSGDQTQKYEYANIFKALGEKH